jgi:hypothetical protein
LTVTGEPTIKEQVIGGDAATAGLHQQIPEHLSGLAQTLGPALEPVGPFVDLGHRRKTVFLLGGTEQTERNRHTG